MLTPLEIAIQEYSYWRDCDVDAAAAAQVETFGCMATGAIGASANIAARLSGCEFLEGIEYKNLTPANIARVLTEIRLAPRMAQFVKDFRDAARYVDGEIATLNKALTDAMLRNEADLILAEIEKAGAL